MKINISIENKQLFLLFSFIILLAGISIVIAIGSNDPNLMGHDSGEIEIDFGFSNIKTLQQSVNDGDLGRIRWDKWVEVQCSGGTGAVRCNDGWIQVGSGHWISVGDNEESYIRCVRIDPTFSNPAYAQLYGCAGSETSATDPYGP